MRLRTLVARTLVLATLVTARAQAQVYSNLPNVSDGFNISESGFNDFGSLAFDDFSLASGSTLSSVRFWSLSTAVGPSNSVDWQIHADAGGSRGGLLFSGTSMSTATNSAFPGCCARLGFQEDFFLSVALGAGTYWLTLFNSTGGAYWQTANQLGFSAQHTSVGSVGQDLAFELYAETTTVPEPSTYLLLGSGLLALGLVARRKGVT